MADCEYVSLPSGEEVLKIPRQHLDEIMDSTKEILWEVIQCMDNGKKFRYDDMVAITMHHYRRLQRHKHGR